MTSHSAPSPRPCGAHRRIAASAAAVALAITSCGTAAVTGNGRAEAAQPPSSATASAPSVHASASAGPVSGSMTMAQTLSDQAQLTTIAFDGLAFLTGTIGSDSFFPPGKVADFWGFQYLRDNDPTSMGHNTDVLTRASLNMLQTMTSAQRAQLIALAKTQVAAINKYGYDRFTLMAGFRRLLAGPLPTGTTGLSLSAVRSYSASLYAEDGAMSLQRATVMGAILNGLTTDQRATLAAMVGKGMTTWPVAAEPSELRGLTGDEKVAVMTYAGDLFSWYAGSVDADVYFCPERQGTYFGSFYLKDAKAVGNPGYSIGTNITADMGNAFLAVLTPTQRAKITALVATQRSSLTAIVNTRRSVSTELRKAMTGGTPDAALVQQLMHTYGSLDGTIVTQYASAFAAVGHTLTAAQRAKLQALRVQTVGTLSPTGAYLYAQPIAIPTIPSTTFLFGH